MKISAVVNTLNAAAMLDEALASVAPWVDEIVVVDMHSTDDTREIAERHGARVLLVEPLGFVEPARAWSVEQASGDWILLLDADEVIPRPLSRRLREIVASDVADVVDIPELNYFFGAPVVHGEWHPDDQRHLRFFRKGMLDFPRKIHTAHAPLNGSRVLTLRYVPGVAISHFAYVTLAEFMQRTDRYTSIDCDAQPGSVGGQAREVIGEIRRRAITYRGIRDGSRGIALAVLMGVYAWMRWLKRTEQHAPTRYPLTKTAVREGIRLTVGVLGLVERRRWPPADEIRRSYKVEARRLVAEYTPPDPSRPSNGGRAS
jgi:glycosyltransferase involved in cell wall biosynthesis